MHTHAMQLHWYVPTQYLFVSDLEQALGTNVEQRPTVIIPPTPMPLPNGIPSMPPRPRLAVKKKPLPYLKLPLRVKASRLIPRTAAKRLKSGSGMRRAARCQAREQEATE